MADVVIIGGGIIGCLTAWSLRNQGYRGKVTVVERDPSYQFSSTARSAASIRAQFGCPVNVELSLFGAHFLRSVKEVLDEDAEIGLVEDGYLILGNEQTLQHRKDALCMQRSLGAQVTELSVDDLSRTYPWLSTDGVAMATLGISGEGWFDAWALLQSARKAALRSGVEFIQDNVIGLDVTGSDVTSIRLASGAMLAPAWVVNAAGALSAPICDWVDIKLPVAPRKRTVFHFKGPLQAAGHPMLFDISGAWMRPEGDGFIGGIQLPDDADPDAHGDFEPDHWLFEEVFWPILAARIPVLEELRLLNAWAGHYEMNLFDHNGVVGPSPAVPNLILATGFSGHGVMHAPGVARAVAELIIHGAYQSIDLSPLSYDRILRGEPMPESAVY